MFELEQHASYTVLDGNASASLYYLTGPDDGGYLKIGAYPFSGSSEMTLPLGPGACDEICWWLLDCISKSSDDLDYESFRPKDRVKIGWELEPAEDTTIINQLELHQSGRTLRFRYAIRTRCFQSSKGDKPPELMKSGDLSICHYDPYLKTEFTYSWDTDVPSMWELLKFFRTVKGFSKKESFLPYSGYGEKVEPKTHYDEKTRELLLILASRRMPSMYVVEDGNCKDAPESYRKVKKKVMPNPEKTVLK